MINPRPDRAPTQSSGFEQSAAVIIPGTVNQSYEQAGQRLAEALTNLGMRTVLCTLPEALSGSRAWAFVVNPYEVAVSLGGEATAGQQLRALRRRCGSVAAVLLECVATKWFSHSAQVAQSAGIDLLIDLGLHDQRLTLPRDVDVDYQFVLNGLTESEHASTTSRAVRASSHDRPLPWALIGHSAPLRVRLLETLVAEYDSRGFVYLPRLEPVALGGPHLTPSQVDTVLRRTTYYVWISHHQHFYLEGERFRQSLETGAIPVKAVAQGTEGPRSPGSDIPFASHLVPLEKLAAWLEKSDVHERWSLFREEFLSLPTLEEGMAGLFDRLAAARGC